MSLIVDEHRAYLSDAVRVRAFERAIAATVRPGDVVVDLGSGTALLGLLACRAGARHVYAIEANGMIEIGRAIALANGLADRITFIKRHSTDVSLPERGDVLVADLVGGMGFEIGLFDIYADARRFLKPGARLIPRAVTMAATPVEDAVRFDEVHFWTRGCSGIDTTPALQWAVNTGYPRLLDPGALLSDTVVRATFDPSTGHALLRIRGEAAVSRAGVVHGIGGWFEADLAEGVTLSNSPLAAERLNRRNVFFPLERAVPVQPGDRVRLHVRIRPTDLVVSWDVEVHAAGAVHRERHSTLDGMLLSREDVRANLPGSAPRLTPRGHARHTVLALCDGRRTLADIEREVFSRHGGLFAGAGEAQAFVAEVVTRYAEQDA
jgi:protein arginine N-methyltransferase 1